MPTKNTPAAEQTETPAPLSRADALAALKDRGYTGPTSFTVSTLRTVLDWLDAGSPTDPGTVPSGVLLAVHPDLRPARASRPVRLTKYQQGYQAALAEVAALATAKAVQQWVADNREKVDA